MIKRNKYVKILDEFVPDYSLSDEEQKKQWDEHRKEIKKALEELFGKEQNNN